jgi:spermidine/putrescine transport system ATP-binding protein
LEQNNIAVETQGISKVFGEGDTKVVALDDISITIRQNEFFTLLGPSGCGKTTLLRLIAGFDFPTDGSILLDGDDISDMPPFKRPVNTVFQSYALFPHMTVSENIAFGLKMLGQSKFEVNKTVDEMLTLVKLEPLKDRKTSQLSGGQQQRVALARALAPHPKILLLDESLSALDLKLRKEMQIELKRLQHETGITFVFVTHDQEEALTMSDRISVMHDGKVLQVGTPREIYDHPSNRFVANFIGDTNFLTAEMTSADGTVATVKLASENSITATLSDHHIELGEVTVAIRPEHASIVKNTAQAAISGTLENIVYFGTDTNYHLNLDDGSRFIVRAQNIANDTAKFEIGETLGIAVASGAASVLGE